MFRYLDDFALPFNLTFGTDRTYKMTPNKNLDYDVVDVEIQHNNTLHLA